MLNAEGFVAECTADNLFIIKRGALFTPPLFAGALYGITRGTVMELAEQLGVKVSETNLTRYDLFNADECFLTGTGAEIMPVIKIDGRVIGSGKPGALTRKLVAGISCLDESFRRADIQEGHERNEKKICSICKEKPATIFLTKISSDNKSQRSGFVRRVRQGQGY